MRDGPDGPRAVLRPACRLGRRAPEKALWNLYWRGTATIRQRIEAELDPDGPRPRRKEPEPAEEVSLLWSRVLDRLGFAEFARSAAPQLVRWESEYGWTRTGFGRVREKETSLAAVLEQLLTLPNRWVAFTDQYLEALDEVVARRSATASSRRRPEDTTGDRRTSDLAEWHAMLIDRLFGSDSEDRLDRLATHPALGGPDLTYFQAQLARRRAVW